MFLQDLLLPSSKVAALGPAELRRQLETALRERARRIRELEEVDARIGLIRAELEGHHDAPPEEEKEEEEEERSSSSVCCAVCLSAPQHKAYACARCDCLLCAGCRSDASMDRCPCCRCDFSGLPPRRNRWAERLTRVLSPPSSQVTTLTAVAAAAVESPPTPDADRLTPAAPAADAVTKSPASKKKD